MTEISQNTIPADLDEKWKERFLIIEKYFNNGNIFSVKKGIDKKEYRKDNNKLIFTASFGLGFLFGPLYYLFKGLWLKAILYTILITLLVFLLSLFDFPETGYAGFGGIWGVLFPFDYYRLKVLKKQW